MSEQNVEPERGITVGKSWPRPTTPAPLIPRWEGEFCSHADWVNFAHKRLTVARDSNGAQLKAMCVDTLGRRCANGRDMQRAHDEGTFPVRYFFDCEAAPANDAQLLEILQSVVAEHDEGRGITLATIGHARAAIARATGATA